MNRRAFFAALAGAAAASSDPERALWVPGRKLISIPAPRPVYTGPFHVYPAMEGFALQAQVLETLINHRWATNPAIRERFDREYEQEIQQKGEIGGGPAATPHAA